MPERFSERNLLPPQKDRPFPVFSSIPSVDKAKTDKKIETSLLKLQHQIFRETRPYVKEDELKDYLTAVGLNAGQTMDAWDQSRSELVGYFEVARKEHSSVQLKNFATIFQIEKMEPGSAKTLQEEFGIKTFGRYPAFMLVEQYNDKENLEKPYGLCVFARKDHNGILYDNHIYSMRHGSYMLRIIEAEGKKDYVEKVLSIHDRYASQGGSKISFEVDFGHGHPDRIRFGSGFIGSSFTQNNLKDEEMVWKLRSCYEEDAVKILASCYTGVKGGLASYMAERLDMTVIGPDDAAGCPVIIPWRRRNNKFDFRVDYPISDRSKGQPNTKRYEPTRKTLYPNAS